MPQTDARPAKRIDSMFWCSAFGCLAMSALGGLLLKVALSENPAETGIGRSYAVAICCCLILALPAFLITVRWSLAGTIGMWLLTCAVAALATLGDAFGLATPLIALLIFAAAISTATYVKDRKPAQVPETSNCAVDTAE